MVEIHAAHTSLSRRLHCFGASSWNGTSRRLGRTYLLGETLGDDITSRSACNAFLSQFSCVAAPRSDREHSRHGAGRPAPVCLSLPVRTVHEQIIADEAHHVIGSKRNSMRSSDWSITTTYSGEVGKGVDCYAGTPSFCDRTRMPVTMMSPDREGGCYV